MSVSVPTSYAMISDDACVLADIYIGMSRDALIDELGEPDRVQRGDVNLYFYDDDDMIVGVYNVGQTVCEVRALPGCEYGTTDGFGVGDSISELIGEYGKPDFAFNDENGAKWYCWYGSKTFLRVKGDRSSRVAELQCVIKNF